MSLERKVVLMRHASAQPQCSANNDRERILAYDGWREIEIIRNKLQGKLDVIDLLLCSNVKRTRQTLEGIKTVLPVSIEIIYEDGLYQITAQRLLNRIQKLPPASHGAMFICHNPALTHFLQLIKSPIEHFPPAAALILSGKKRLWNLMQAEDLQQKEWLLPTE